MHIVRTYNTVLALAVVLIGLGVVDQAYAVTLDEARAQGLIGEKPDGLVASVSSNTSSEIAALVASINSARLNSYRQLATKDGAPLEAVQAIAGEKLVSKARENGWYVMDASGRWSK